MSTLLLLAALLLVMVAGAVLISRRLQVDDEFSGGALGATIAPCVLALYLVAAAMGAVIAWENFTTAQDGVVAEAGAARSLYWSTTALPEDEAAVVRENLRAYLTSVVEDDWPRMVTEGELSAEGDEAMAELTKSVRTLSASDSGDGLDRLTARQELGNLSDARVARSDAAGDGIPTLLLVLTAASGAVVAVMPFAMIKRGARVAYLWATVNLLFVFATIALLFYIGDPYASALRADAEGLSAALVAFERVDSTAVTP